MNTDTRPVNGSLEEAATAIAAALNVPPATARALAAQGETLAWLRDLAGGKTTYDPRDAGGDTRRREKP